MVATHNEHDCPRLLSDIRKDLLAVFGDDIDEYFSVSHAAGENPEWPTRFRWIACYAVTGGSEGHYIHVDALCPGFDAITATPIFLGKTFLGIDHALKIAGICAKELGA